MVHATNWRHLLISSENINDQRILRLDWSRLFWLYNLDLRYKIRKIKKKIGALEINRSFIFWLIFNFIAPLI